MTTLRRTAPGRRGGRPASAFSACAVVAAIAVGWLTLVASLSAEERSAESAPQDISALDRDIAATIEEAATPGAVVVVVEDGEISLIKGYGYADLESGTPMSRDTLLSVGSLSKNLTSLGALRLVEEGRLRLDARLADIDPSIAPDNPWRDEHPILIAHLLEHTAGIEGSTYHEYGLNELNASPTDYARRIAPKLKVRWAPGYFFSYANPGHTLAAAAMESACACAFDDFMEREILRPIGMTRATFRQDAAAEEGLAQSYRTDGRTPSSRWRMAIRPSGSLLATADDLAALIVYYASRGATADIAPPALLERMENAETAATARAGIVEGGYALANVGFFAGKGKIFHGHGGSTDGFRTWFGYDPETRSGFAVVTNGGSDDMRFILRRKIGAYLTRNEAEVPRAPAIGGVADEVDEGWYAPVTHNMPLRSWLFRIFSAVKLQAADDRLIIEPIAPLTPSSSLIHVGEGLFRREDAPIPTVAVVENWRGERLFVNREAYEKINAGAAYGLFYGFVGGVIFSLVACVHGAIWGPMLLLDRLRDGAGARLRAALLVAGASLLGMLSIFVWRGMIAGLDVSGGFGRIGPSSIALFALSVIGPVATAVAALTLVRLSGPRLPLKIYGGAAVVFIGAAWGIAAAHGWVPLITWRA